MNAALKMLTPMEGTAHYSTAKVQVMAAFAAGGVKHARAKARVIMDAFAEVDQINRSLT